MVLNIFQPYSPAHEKMEKMILEMSKSENDNGMIMRAKRGIFSDSFQSFTGADLIEWIKRRYSIQDIREATSLASMLCLYGYIYPVDFRSYVVKDDRSTEYRFQTPYYWPYKTDGTADSIKYAIYLQKRSLRNKQKHGLEDYELEAYDKLMKVFCDKKEFIEIQAREQVHEIKKRRRPDKFLTDQQERAFWRVNRPPPGTTRCLEEGPKRYFQPSQMEAKRRKNKEGYRLEINFLRRALEKPRLKFSKVFDCYCMWNDQYKAYDPFMDATSTQPSNPWISDDTTYWEANAHDIVTPTELRVKKWAISFHDLISDEIGRYEFAEFLKKEYSVENILFFNKVEELHKAPVSRIKDLVYEIHRVFLDKGAEREINIDSKTLEEVIIVDISKEKYVFDPAQEHVYLLMKKDSYTRYLRSEQYKKLLEKAHSQPIKRRFFNFGGSGKMNKRQTPSPKLGRRRDSNSSDRDANSDISLDSPVHHPNLPQHSYSTGNLKELDVRQTPTASSGASPGLLRRKSDEPNTLNVIHVSTGNRRKSNLEVPNPYPVNNERRKSDISTCVNISVPSSNCVAPWEGSD
ncbi:hypothetical protein FSP39_019219 [Pinctada imbricata]|uniref:Uncharacterized protein n=1 Tax=Pinctada imbricata TaxID=66713 RepID=A0AA88XT31_PINIB|nr:hypothetical protein FSP39_019219 [Pinctada imbricata]